jgi:hypothetical protein
MKTGKTKINDIQDDVAGFTWFQAKGKWVTYVRMKH